MIGLLICIDGIFICVRIFVLGIRNLVFRSKMYIFKVIDRLNVVMVGVGRDRLGRGW